jgi:hypothetical protein
MLRTSPLGGVVVRTFLQTEHPETIAKARFSFPWGEATIARNPWIVASAYRILETAALADMRKKSLTTLAP